jgi:hypothetical protein
VSGETCVGVNYRYSSEMHPPHAIASIRQGRGYKFRPSGAKPPIAVTRVDVYINAFAGGAGDRCVLSHHSNSRSAYRRMLPAVDPVACGIMRRTLLRYPRHQNPLQAAASGRR